MSRRIEQVNELLKNELANLIAREISMDNGLITISYVKCPTDLRCAKVGISVLPENLTGTAMKKLKQNNKLFSSLLKKKLSIKHIPRFIWIIDDTERRAAVIEETIKKIKRQKK